MLEDKELPGLLEVFAAPAWHADAKCKGRTELFFAAPGDTSTSAKAKALCSGCSVRTECSEAAEGERGTWAGVTEVERRALRRGAA